mgnify:CR=1 FL=1
MIDSKILRRRKGDRFIGLADTIHGVVYKVNNGDTTKIRNKAAPGASDHKQAPTVPFPAWKRNIRSGSAQR